MKEKNRIVQAVTRVSFVTGFLRTFGVILFVAAVITTAKGIELSNVELNLAEAHNLHYAGEQTTYPSTGIDYELEARILGEDTVSGWYHDSIAAEYGDTIEFRLKVIAADPSDIDQNAIKDRTLYAPSSGLKLLKSVSDYTFTVLPDEIDDPHIAYVPSGIYRLTAKDWLIGGGSSTIAPLDPSMATGLQIVAPYCDVDILTIVVFVVAAIMFGIVIPIIVEREARPALTLVYSNGPKKGKS